MKVLVDTCVWSLALRRQKPSIDNPFVNELKELISETRVQLIGPIRQEILSGIPSKTQFAKLRRYLSAFPDLLLDADIYETAAQFFNINRAKGIQGSNIDFLICAVSVVYAMPILSFDQDFNNFKQHTPIKLLQPRDSGA